MSRRRLLWAIIAVSLASLVLGVFTLLIWTFQLSRDVRGCVTPGGTCYRHSVEIESLAAYCADAPGQQTITEIRRCVERRLAAAEEGNR